MPRFRAKFEPGFLEDQTYWKSADPKTAAKIIELTRNALETPFTCADAYAGLDCCFAAGSAPARNN